MDYILDVRWLAQSSVLKSADGRQDTATELGPNADLHGGIATNLQFWCASTDVDVRYVNAPRQRNLESEMAQGAVLYIKLSRWINVQKYYVRCACGIELGLPIAFQRTSKPANKKPIN